MDRATERSEASGTFDVTLTPTGGADDAVGRLALTKTFHGDLEATSVGEMLAVRMEFVKDRGIGRSLA